MSGAPPVIPADLQPYNSYEVDPQWQHKFTVIWTTLLASAVVYNLPHLVRSIRDGKAFIGLLGINEDWNTKYEPLARTDEKLPQKASTRLSALLQRIGSVTLWSLPAIGLNLGHIFVICVYFVLVLVCIIRSAPLISNPNRAGFLALAQLPVVFLFATKNSILSLLLGPGHGYEKLNFIHRWSGRCLFLGGLVHGSLWINDHLYWGEPILGQQKETSGVAAFGLLCVIVLTSLKPARKWFYEFFFITHILGFVAFFVTICYHTPYASPWIFPPLALYGLDMLMRMLRYRIKDASLSRIDSTFTLINIPACTCGWSAGQHIRLRVFFQSRVFESHPLTILSAPQSITCLGATSGIMLGARVKGDWTRALNSYAQTEGEAIIARSLSVNEKATSEENIPVPVHVLMDGPYGGCSIDLGRYETVLLFAGGSGATFTIALLDDIVGRCVRLKRQGGERTRRIEFSWCIRSFGQIEWFSAQLMQIALAAAESDTLDLHLSIYVTCLCDPGMIPSIPNLDVTISRPSIYEVLSQLMTPPSGQNVKTSSEKAQEEVVIEDAAMSESDAELGPEVNISSKLKWVGIGGGVAVCASGPENMTRSASNAVARMSMARGVQLGGVALHTELFSI